MQFKRWVILGFVLLFSSACSYNREIAELILLSEGLGVTTSGLKHPIAERYVLLKKLNIKSLKAKSITCKELAIIAGVARIRGDISTDSEVVEKMLNKGCVLKDWEWYLTFYKKVTKN